MKIYFVTIKGFDSKLAWDYDELNNRATCAPPVNTQGNVSPKAFEMPLGMTMEDQMLVINDVKTFKLKYPFTKTPPSLEPPKSPSGDHFFSPKRSSPVRIRTHLDPSSPRKRKVINPDSILLTDLIHKESDPQIIRETISYRKIHELQQNSPEARYLKTEACLFKTSVRSNELKVSLLNIIEQTLKTLNVSYIDFCQKNPLSPEVKSEICEYFRQAILQTMANSSFRKTPDGFLNLQETVFYKNTESQDYFCNQSRQLKLQVLTLNWQALVDDKLDLKYSTAPTFSVNMQGSLKNFKVLLQSEPEIKNSLATLIDKMGAVILDLGLEEQRQDTLIEARSFNPEKINNYYSLFHLLNKQISALNIKMPYDLHLELPPKVAKDILSFLVTQLSKSDEFNKEKYEPLMSKFSYFDKDIFISPEWIGQIQERCKQTIESKKFPKEITLTCLHQIVSLFQQEIFECLQSLLRFNVPHEIESSKSSSPNPLFNR